MRLFLCRHGQTEHNCTDTIQGQSESKLTDKGLKQAEALGKRLRSEDVDFLYSSSMPRAVKTARNSWKFRQENCNINLFSWSEERGWMIEYLNKTVHLEDL
ncbi:histidine phosphatase family protein [Candidatus Nanohalobium constans]|uniref:Phosphoserine phosphatase n=1 Tax=Candidatus Nanohalobium constans TaxID=2565781 RepID=A0A5Q0UF32_9ARCH|nr:histidine phosphatase family protein [Candidatus Nanohalobium constans]QGA80104.1 phosphoserine phosphatase [Candidatus Nanohalobium constans]